MVGELRACRWPLVCAGTTRRRAFCLATRSSCATTRRPTLTRCGFLAALGHRVLHLTAHMNMFVPVLIAVAACCCWSRGWTRRGMSGRGSAGLRRGEFFCCLLANALLFSVLGGALLTRYLLPMYPLVLLVAVSTFYRRVPFWQGLAVLSAAAFVLGLFVNPPYGFAPEDNLAYAHVIRLHLAGIAQLNKRYPGATVLSAWPMTRRADPAGAGLLEEAVRRLPPRRFHARSRLRAPAQSRRSIRGAGVFDQVRPAAAAAQPGPGERSAGRAILWAAPRSVARRDRAANWVERWCGRGRTRGNGWG